MKCCYNPQKIYIYNRKNNNIKKVFKKKLLCQKHHPNEMKTTKSPFLRVSGSYSYIFFLYIHKYIHPLTKMEEQPLFSTSIFYYDSESLLLLYIPSNPVLDDGDENQ